MEKSKPSWSKQTAVLHHKIASILLIVSGISGLYLSIDDIIILGNRLSTFVFPYFFNYFCFFFSVFQLYVSICFLSRQKWTKKTMLWILVFRLFMINYDFIEIIPAVIMLPYLLFILSDNRSGSLFVKDNSEVSS